jgi:hypothetical protein
MKQVQRVGQEGGIGMAVHMCCRADCSVASISTKTAWCWWHTASGTSVEDMRAGKAGGGPCITLHAGICAAATWYVPGSIYSAQVCV